MAQPLKSINLIAPAFKGVNTEDSPLAQDPSFAEVADNAVIDRRGRLASRKGYSVVTETKTELGSDSLRAIKEFRDSDGNTLVFSVGNNKILSGTTTLTDATPGSYTVSNDNWKLVNFNDHMYFFQAGQEPLVYSNSLGAVTKMSSVHGAHGVASTMYGNEVLAAWGRLFTADVNGNPNTIYWSDLQQGHNWSSGSSGSIDVEEAWPNGYDEIVALAAHNDFLVVFGRESIIVYSGADDPANMAISDTINGIGCVDRDTVQSTGKDLLFLAKDGLRGLGRTIQENSLPIARMSNTITEDIITLIDSETAYFRSVYHPEENFYLITFVGGTTTYCFDVRQQLEDGSFRVTRWPNTSWTCYESTFDGDLRIGSSDGIGTYSGYDDNGTAYRMVYSSPELSFGDSATLKLLKKIRPTIIGGSGQDVSLKWKYDFGSRQGSKTIVVDSDASAEFNVAQYNIGQFSGGTIVIRKPVNANGSGATLSIRIEVDINGTELSIQEINVLALTGRIL